jgi:hypothetical protein
LGGGKPTGRRGWTRRGAAAALAGWGLTGVAEADADRVAFEARFASPPVQPSPVTAQGSRLQASLRIVNRTARPLAFVTVASMLPELVDASGRAEAMSGGANLGRVAHAADVRTLTPGEALEIPVAARLTLREGRLQWRGDDGLTGDWAVSAALAPYRLRLRYHALAPLPDLWPGLGVTRAAPLPLGF